MSGAQRTKPGNGNKSASNGKSQASPPLRIEDVVAARSTNGEEPAKCDNDVRELQRASKVSYAAWNQRKVLTNFQTIAGNQSQQSPHHETNLQLRCAGDSRENRDIGNKSHPHIPASISHSETTCRQHHRRRWRGGRGRLGEDVRRERRLSGSQVTPRTDWIRGQVQNRAAQNGLYGE